MTAEPLELARRWATLKARVLRLRREREECEEAEPGDPGNYDGVPPCWTVGMDGHHGMTQDGLVFSEWCGPCKRNQARYLYRQYTQRTLSRVQRKLLKAFE